MVTVIVLAGRSAEALAVTLGALVPGVADGLIADAVVVMRDSPDAVATVADTMGATPFVLGEGADPWRAAVRLARREWVLCLEAGDIPGEGWIRALDTFVLYRADAAFARLSRRPASLKDRLSRALAAVTGASAVGAGDLVQRSLLVGNGGLPRPVRLPVRVEREEAARWRGSA